MDFITTDQIHRMPDIDEDGNPGVGDTIVIARDLNDPAYTAWLGEKLPGPLDVADVVRLVQEQLDRAARVHGFDDIKTAITYRGDPNPQFAAHAEALFLWRSACWTAAYTYLGQVEAGVKPLPTIDELPRLLPQFDAN